MGALLDVLLGRRFKTSKFKTLAKLAISRIAILKNQRYVRYSHAKFDVVELLKLGLQDRALLRVEHMMKEQNLMDAYVMIENYCHLLLDRIMLLRKERECHDEVKEAISSLVFASFRCGEFPELRKIRQIFASRYGKEFVARAVELRNNCGVNPKIIQKLSVRQPSLESRLEVLKEIAAENYTVLHLEDAPVASEEKLDAKQKQKQQAVGDAEPQGKPLASIEVLGPDNGKLVKSLKARTKYKDVASAALEAFESALYAATAAKAAFELSMTESQKSNQGEHPGFGHPFDGAMIPYEYLEKNEDPSFQPEGEDATEGNQNMKISQLEGSKNDIYKEPSGLSSDSEEKIPSANHQNLDYYRKASYFANGIEHVANAVDEHSSGHDVNKPACRSQKQITQKFEVDIMSRSKFISRNRTISSEQPNSKQRK